MIDRYSTREMRDAWSLHRKFEIWQQIELYACEYWYNEKKIPEADWQQIHKVLSSGPAFTVERVLEIENQVHHDVIAFLTNVAENVGSSSRFIHFGLTSSDVVDTGLSVILMQTGEAILKASSELLKELYAQVNELKDLITVGRTHGVHAEPTTMGLKLAGYYTETLRNHERLKSAIAETSFGKISGAVGTYSQLPPELEAFVLNKLNLQAEPVSTQVIPRDRHAALLNAIALYGTGLSRLAQEIRLLQKTESRELEEPFQKGQKGSSAMPHKRNPILCERICGLSRVLTGYAQTGLQNVGLWHERDISHSGAERVILPDATSLLEYMIQKMTFVIGNLNVYPENCARALDSTKGLLYSSRALLVLTEELGLTREEVYKIVQTEAMNVWADANGPGLRERLSSQDLLKNIPQEKWEYIFDPTSFLSHVQAIIERLPQPESVS